MRHIRSLVPCLLFLLSAGVPADAQDVRIRHILMWQDQRRAADSLVLALRDADARIRLAAACALGNLQDTNSALPLAHLLTDRDRGVERMAAFALGQMPCLEAERSLRRGAARERNARTSRALCDALGRCGGQASLDTLADWMAEGRISHEAAAHAFVRFAIRGVRSDHGIWQAFALLKSKDPEVRWRALHALWRWTPSRLIDIECTKGLPLLTRLIRDPAPDVRMNMATLLGRTAADGTVPLLLRLSGEEPKRPGADWRVEVNCARALLLRLPTDPSIFPIVLALLGTPDEHVQIAALQALEQAPLTLWRDSSMHKPLTRKLVEILRAGSTEHEVVQAEACVMLGRLDDQDEVALGERLDHPAFSLWMKTKMLEAYGQYPSKRNINLLVRYLDDDSTRLAAAAWDHLRRIWIEQYIRVVADNAEFWQPIVPMITEKAQKALGRNDMALTTTVASFFGDTSGFRWFAKEHQGAVLRRAFCEAAERMSSVSDVEALQALIGTIGSVGDSTCVPTLLRLTSGPERSVAADAARALRQLTGRSIAMPARSLPQHTDYDWQMLDSARSEPVVRIETEKGTIELELLPDDAPFTVLSMIRLIRSGFFNGLTFHRVVPNFVVQGGDPRGDGWGGPGYSIRTEVSPREYERGSVGVASAGKDTEGCQFFFTHAPTPHLDGRYTIFARVRKGMDVVDRLQIGDRMTVRR